MIDILSVISPILSARNQQAQLAEQARQFGISSALDKARLAEQARQFGENTALNREQFGMTFPESQRQFDINTGLNQQRIGLDYGNLANNWLGSLLGFLR